jgi:hypothetical protein
VVVEMAVRAYQADNWGGRHSQPALGLKEKEQKFLGVTVVHMCNFN